jgi:chemotaxis protein methyltransferase CheR
MDTRHALPDPLLSRLSEFLAAHTGLHFPPERWGDLARGLAAAAREFGLPDVEACAHWLLAAPLTRAQIEVLASQLTVGETYFFREPAVFEALEREILPALIQTRRASERRLRIWSAGCCTGEEPYSIAILLDRLLPEAEAWNVTILATDINPLFLRKAAEAVYGEWSFRDTPGWIRERYFRRTRDGRFELHPRLRRRVVFSYLNLADDVYPSLATNTNAMDLIFCRNVLMYFTPERASRVVANLHHALLENGWLVVSPSEISHTLFAAYAPAALSGTVLYRKGGAPRAAAEQWPAALGPVTDAAWSPIAAIPQPVPFAAPPAPVPVAEESPPPAATVAPALAARHCANEGRLAEAVAWCEQAIAADKLEPAHHYLLATIRQEQGQAGEAAESLRRALYLDPGFVLAHFALGNLRLSQGRRAEGERHLANALALLRKRPPAEILAESDGLTAGRLGEIVASVLSSLPRAAAGA